MIEAHTVKDAVCWNLADRRATYNACVKGGLSHQQAHKACAKIADALGRNQGLRA